MRTLLKHILATFCAVFAASAIAQADTSRSGASVKIDGARGSVFAAGASVEITGAIDPDLTPATGVFAAGGAVDVSAEIDGALIAVGGDVTFSGGAKNLFISGGNVTVAGAVDQDAMIAGGNVTVSRLAAFRKDLHAAGASIDVDGSVSGDANLAGAFVRLTGVVDGDAEFAGEDIVIGPGARIGGDLTYYAPKEAEISQEAQIGGAVVYKQASERSLKRERERRMPLGQGDFQSRAYGALFWFVALAGSGALMALLFPRWFGEAAAAGRDRPLSSLLIGFAVLIAMPVAAVLLMAMILGLPFGGFLLALYAALLIISMVGAGLGAGHLMFDRGGDRQAKLLPYFAGLAVLLVVGAAPVVGGIVTFFAMLLGMGVLFRGLWSALRADPT